MYLLVLLVLVLLHLCSQPKRQLEDADCRYDSETEDRRCHQLVDTNATVTSTADVDDMSTNSSQIDCEARQAIIGHFCVL